ncbi:MAG TPA: ATP-binding protein, partial [Polyangia bacterium]
PSLLRASHRSAAEVKKLLGELERRSADDPTLHAEVEKLSDAASERMASLDRTLALFQRGQHDQAIARLRAGEGQVQMSRGRVLIEDLVRDQHHRLNHAVYRSEADAWRVSLLIAFGNSFALLFLTGSWLLFTRESLRRRELQQELVVRREREVLLGRVEEEKKRLDQILEELPVGVCIAEAPSGRIIYNNERVARIYHGKLPRIESVRDYGRFDVRRPDGSPLPIEDNPLARALHHGETVHGQELRLVRPDKEVSTLKVNAAPLRGAHGEVVAALGVFDDFTAEKRAVEELSQAAHFREMFMNILGHDLRNPLSVITTGAQLLSRREHTEREARLLERMVASAWRMAHMIDQLMDFTRSRLGGGIPIAPRPSDLGQIARQAIDSAEVVVERPIELTTDGDTSGEWDPARMTQVVENLLANAAQHGRSDLPVTARVHGEGGEVTVEVHNQGAPIPPELMPVLFDPFRRAAERKRMKSTGLGLGLYLAQQIVAAHGGRIAVDSSAESGTTFKVVLPRRKEA